MTFRLECLWRGERRLREFYSYLRVKSWSCCGIQTLDFGAFLAQPGCRVGRHDWGKQVSPDFNEPLIRTQFPNNFSSLYLMAKLCIFSLCMDQIRFLLPVVLQYEVVLIFLAFPCFFSTYTMRTPLGIRVHSYHPHFTSSF